VLQQVTLIVLYIYNHYSPVVELLLSTISWIYHLLVIVRAITCLVYISSLYHVLVVTSANNFLSSTICFSLLKLCYHFYRQRLIRREAFSEENWKKIYFLSNGNGTEIRGLVPFMRWQTTDALFFTDEMCSDCYF